MSQSGREKIAGVEAEMQTTADTLRECIEQNAAAQISEEEFREQYDALHEQFRKLEQRLDKLSSNRFATISGVRT